MDSLGGDCKPELPKVSFHRLDFPDPCPETWAATRAQVAGALATYGGFEVVSDQIKAHIQDGLFGSVMPEVFMESNLNGPSLLNYDGAWIQRDSELLPIKSLKVANPDSLAAVQESANGIWPQGNELFIDNIWNCAKQMKKLVHIIHRMILESLGLEGHFDSHLQSLQYSLRLSEYHTDAQNPGTKAGIPPHVDPNFLSVICQDKKGLEVETPNGEWVETTTKADSFIVLLGEVFTAWTNGILRAPKHRVKMDCCDEKRYSAIFNTYPSFGEELIETPRELVDEKHPLLFKPFKYCDYIEFRHSEEGEKHKNVLEAYCGVEPAKIAV